MHEVDDVKKTQQGPPQGTQRMEADERQAGVPAGKAVPVVAAVCSVVAVVALRMIHRSFKSLRARLQDTEKQCEELTAACSASQAKIDELVKTLEEKTKELAEKERSLEQLRVEQQLSKSMASMVERELKTTKKLLASYQGQLDQATYVLKENNRQSENANTPGAYGFTGGFWG